jgi:hypothetical protein
MHNKVKKYDGHNSQNTFATRHTVISCAIKWPQNERGDVTRDDNHSGFDFDQLIKIHVKASFAKTPINVCNRM